MKRSPRDILSAVLPGREIAVLTLAADRLFYALERRGNGGAVVEEFRFPDGASWDEPDRLGAAMRDHLQAQGLSVRRAGVLVLPVDWTVLRTTQFPPATDASLLEAMVATAAEEALAERPEDLAYAWQSSVEDRGVRVSIFGCPRDRLRQARAFLDGAALTCRRIVPAQAATSLALCEGAGKRLAVVEAADNLSVLLVENGRCTWQRDVPAGPNVADEELAAHLRRAVLVMPSANGAELTVVAATRGAAVIRDALADGRAGDTSPRPSDELSAGEFIEALVRARPALQQPSLDLLSEHRGGPSTRMRRALHVAAPVAAVLLVVLVWFVVTWIGARRTVASTRATLADLAPRIDRASRLRTLNAAVDPWFPANPGYLDALRALAGTFPDEGTIWLTGVEMDRSGEITISGEARRRSNVLELLAELEADEHFVRVSRHFVREQTGRRNVTAFSVSCNHQGGPGR